MKDVTFFWESNTHTTPSTSLDTYILMQFVYIPQLSVNTRVSKIKCSSKIQYNYYSNQLLYRKNTHNLISNLRRIHFKGHSWGLAYHCETFCVCACSYVRTKMMDQSYQVHSWIFMWIGYVADGISVGTLCTVGWTVRSQKRLPSDELRIFFGWQFPWHLQQQQQPTATTTNSNNHQHHQQLCRLFGVQVTVRVTVTVSGTSTPVLVPGTYVLCGPRFSFDVLFPPKMMKILVRQNCSYLVTLTMSCFVEFTTKLQAATLPEFKLNSLFIRSNYLLVY